MSMILTADDHLRVLAVADQHRIPLTFCGRGEVLTLGDVWLDVPHCIAPSGRLLLPSATRANAASIPRITWSVMGHPFMDDVLVPALGHDLLYQLGALCGLARKAVDWGFYQMLLWWGATRRKAEAMYAAVRLFGARSWGSRPSLIEAVA